MSATPWTKPSASYSPIRRNPGVPQVHCEALTGRLVIGGACWGEVAWIETRSPLHGRCASARCMGHRGIRYAAEGSEVRS